MPDDDRSSEAMLACIAVKLASDMLEESLDTLELNDEKLAYLEAQSLASRLTERVRRLRYKLRA